jgi:hypothetical protein
MNPQEALTIGLIIMAVGIPAGVMLIRLRKS